MPKPLKEIRTGRQIGVRRLSQGAPVSPRTVITTEKGESRPGVDTIRKISRYLDVDPMEVTEFRAALEELGLDGLPEEPASPPPPAASPPRASPPAGDLYEAWVRELEFMMREFGRLATEEAYRRAFGTRPEPPS